MNKALFRLYRKILRAKVRVHFHLLTRGHHFGEQCGEDVYINLMKHNPPARNYIHEVIHFLYPEWPETTVLGWESILWNKMNAQQRLAIYRKMFGR